MLNERLADAKTTNDLRSILLCDGKPIYDYAGGSDSGPDGMSVSSKVLLVSNWCLPVPQPQAPISLPAVLPAPPAPNPDSGRGTGAPTGDYVMDDMEFGKFAHPHTSILLSY